MPARARRFSYGAAGELVSVGVRASDGVNEPRAMVPRSDTWMSGSQGAAHRDAGWSLECAGRRFGSGGGLHGSGWQCSDLDATRFVSRGGAAKFAQVLYLDLDRFKVVNDSLGHATGDALLIEAARRIALVLGPEDMLARVDGDEFVLCAMNVPATAMYSSLRPRFMRSCAQQCRLADEKCSRR